MIVPGARAVPMIVTALFLAPLAANSCAQNAGGVITTADSPAGTWIGAAHF